MNKGDIDPRWYHQTITKHKQTKYNYLIMDYTQTMNKQSTIPSTSADKDNTDK